MKQTYKLIFIALILLGLCVSVVQATVDPYTSSLLHFNGTWADETGKTWTPGGGAILNATVFKFGGGSGGFVYNEGSTLGTNPSTDFSWSSNGTIDFWMYLDHPHSGYSYVFTTNITAANNAPILLVDTNTDGNDTIMAYSSSTSAGGQDILSGFSLGTIPVKTWTHYALVWDGTTFYGFKNGGMVSSSTSALSPEHTLATHPNFGTITGSGVNSPMNIDEFRFSKGIARWTSNFTPPAYQYDLTAPVASFTATPTSGYSPLAVLLTDTSIYTPTRWLWEAKNVTGNNTWISLGSTNPLSTSLGVGNYSIRVNATNGAGSNTSTQITWVNVSVGHTISADFTASNTSGIQPLLVTFADTSTTTDATIDAWAWDFGDGNTSTSQSPSHLYEVPGTYQANMTITNTSYSLVSSKDQTITVNNYPPVANFIASNMSGQPPLPVAFTDTSTGNNITVWNWDFGDGNTSSLQNPEHTFESVGEYQVNLTVTNDGGSSIKLQNVSVVTFGADFTASNTSGNPPLYVQFTDTTTGIKVDEWQWDFGDGNTSILQSPSHLYEVPGTYQANMTITNTSYSLVSSKDQTITVNNYPPVANFIASNMSGQPPLPVAFTDTSTGNNITVWNWDFGDGNTSSLQNPTHIFADNGTYTVNLTVVNDGGSSTKLQDIIVSFFAPAYTATPSSGSAPLTVQFTETTTGKIPDSYYWEFGDGGTDNVQNPVHVYNSVGVYNVNHRITNESLVVWNNKTAFIHVNQTPAADFTGTPLSGYLNPATMSVSFTDMSIGEGISQWSWNFGDGSANATTKNPSHAYALPGTYSVFLKVWGADGNASVTKPGYITVNPLTADFTTSTVASNVGIPIFFNDTSDGYPTSWYWDFGDGTISTTKNNSYAYASTGTYTVKFRVTNGVETSWKNETNLITISGVLPPAPIVDFEAIPVSASTGSAIQFYDLSGNAPSSWAWEFGDGSTSTLKNPSHTYVATGSYTVNLTATNSGGSDTESKTGYITITTLPPPTAAFSASSTLTYVGGTVSFTDESTGSPTSWSWNFGDGTTSSLRNPGHSYTSAGTYTVILTATNVYGSDVLTKPAYITVEAVPPTIPPTSYVITNPATGTTNNAVTMNGYTAATTYKYHFEYGLKSSTYSYSTKPKDGVAGNFSVTVEGLPLLPDETYYFRAVIQEDGEYVSGNELTYLTSPDSGIDSYPEFEEREEALIESNWEFEKLLEVIPSPFVDTMGNIFWGIIFGGAFFILWARTHKIVIPALFGIISGGMLWNIMPPSWVAFGSAMFYLSIAALVYWIILGRQS